MTSRREEREYALKAFYAYEFTKDNIDNVIDRVILENTRESKSESFAAVLLERCLENINFIDETIIKKVENWDFSRIAIIDKLILRLAITEFLYFKDIPPKVTIDEAIEVAKKYSTQKSGGFINGVLNAVFKDLKLSGKLIKSGRGLINNSPKKTDSSI